MGGGRTGGMADAGEPAAWPTQRFSPVPPGWAGAAAERPAARGLSFASGEAGGGVTGAGSAFFHASGGLSAGAGAIARGSALVKIDSPGVSDCIASSFSLIGGICCAPDFFGSVRLGSDHLAGKGGGTGLPTGTGFGVGVARGIPVSEVNWGMLVFGGSLT